ncbi:hypothetical protein [Chromobacterium amazonense]|uniref:Uncharacterized protein n=1 Tax=Chromobacterium amazonense TaxID=1382803 RepID=A0ABU8UYC2_9NEIS|nr:hypothetical protein [Chromobacterium amazonense]MDQ4541720.1 hypothetical protein [Chromobacterium amazonense]
MAIEISVGKQQNFNFNESRIDRIISANTLAEASKMGLWDKIKDYFQGGVKRQAIETLFNSIHRPSEQNREPLGMLEKFERLTELAHPRHQNDFLVDVHAPGKDGKWGYALRIAEHTVYQSGMLADTPETPFNDFCVGKIGMEFRQFVAHHPDSFTLDSYMESNIQCMSDDPDTQQMLRSSLDDSRYGRENLLAVTEHADPSKFIARFKTGDLVLSNRISSNMEFRGDRLKSELWHGDYQNLRDLCAKGHLTEQDSMLRYAATPQKEALRQLMDDYDLDAPDVARALHQQPVGHTTLGKLFGIPQAVVNQQPHLHTLLSLV